MSIEKTLDSLQPYVIGIRYLNGMPLVDTIFKEGWKVPDDARISKMKGEDEKNYLMLYSETEGVGLDDLLAFVGKTIKLNIEREKKHDLLKLKINELTEIFKKNNLEKLNKITFSFSEEDLVPSLTDLDYETPETVGNVVEAVVKTPKMPKKPNNEYEVSDITEDLPYPIVDLTNDGYYNSMEEEHSNKVPYIEPVVYLDENGEKIPMSDEELELIEEEQRAEQSRIYLNSKKNENTKKITAKIELPPKR